MTICNHDYEHPRRVGRAWYVCQKCGADISMEVILIAAAEEESERVRQVCEDIERISLRLKSDGGAG